MPGKISTIKQNPKKVRKSGQREYKDGTNENKT